MELRSQMGLVLVAEESPRLAAGAFHQDSPRRTGGHRIKIIAILYIRRVREAQFLVNRLLFLQLFMTVHGQGHMMNRAGSEAPAPGRAIGIVFKSQSLSGPAGAHLEAVKLAFLASFAKAQSFREET